MSSKKLLNKGFTLIELLVVISIIGLISSIVLANVVSARKKAQAAYVVASLRQIGNGISLYYLQNNSYPDAAYGINDQNQTVSVGGMAMYGSCIGEGPCELNGSVSQNNTIINQLNPYFSSASTLKAHSFSFVAYNQNITVKGYWYGCYTKDTAGRCNVGQLITYFEGRGACPTLGAVLDPSSGTITQYGITYTKCQYQFGQ